MNSYTEEEIIKRLQRVIYDDEDADEVVYGDSKYRPPRPDNRILSSYNGVRTTVKSDLKVIEFKDDDDKDSEKNVIWEGHVVSKRYVNLLSYIKIRYPETFEGVKFSRPEFDTFAYNLLGKFVTDLNDTRVKRVYEKDIVDYKNVMHDLEVMNFKIEWLREQLEKLEKVLFLLPVEIFELENQVEEKKKEHAKLTAEFSHILCVADVF